MKNGEILGETYFRDFLQTVCHIDANDMAFEIYVKCATFSYKNVFLIPYGLKTNSNTVKFDFERDFLKVCRNGANNIPLDSYRKCET